MKMTEANVAINNNEDIDKSLVDSIDAILSKLNIQKVYFVDDAINLNIGKETFVGIVQSIIGMGKIDDLKAISIQAIDFNLDEEILIDHINKTWDDIKPSKQLRYYKNVYEIVGEPKAINDLNVSNHLKNFFNQGILQCLTPIQWDEKKDSIIQKIDEGKRIMVLFDQDLKLGKGRFTDQNIQGEDLILELKQKALGDKVLISLFTHTITGFGDELNKRKEICDATTLRSSDFFVLAKSRLDKHDLFADGIKKACLNTFCESIKESTIGILLKSQKNTIERLEAFDTYDFDHTVFKSSFTEGLWEPDTLLRITDIIFRDEVKKLMIQESYVPKVNTNICSARDVSNIEFKIKQETVHNLYNEKFRLRHQELYEANALLNELRRPIDNGDIFKIIDGEGKNRKFILVAQECDLMIRSAGDKIGKRSSKTAILLEISTFTEGQLFAEMEKTYKSQIEKKNFTNHYYSDKYKLEYFEESTNKNGIVNFKESFIIDLNVLDLIVFNGTGESVLDFDSPTYDAEFHNFAWRKRYELLKNFYLLLSKKIDTIYDKTLSIEDDSTVTQIHEAINISFSFINEIGIQVSYQKNKFNFGIQRISRLRLPKSKNLLDRYYQHLSRFAELHDFAKL